MNDLKDIFQNTANQLIDKAPIDNELKGPAKELITNTRDAFDTYRNGNVISGKPTRPAPAGMKPMRPEPIGVKPKIQEPTPKKQSGWSKFLSGLKRFGGGLWKIVGNPLKGMLNTVLPGSGNAISALENIRKK
ncbi:Hypothetical_protein [Hexamita inflata]|uniref:Hypothetical_protein n=1 Tax=Hexamita inflata TaxID=28002 RepID=A0AA86QVV2_9EUKA|nr:Hypothetical protein HINF_LOCUS44044 [Hexamita inflata]CAI9961757.1 Hypothetical protein HINF_LOCUS49402 [Hexamita inflata]